MNAYEGLVTASRCGRGAVRLTRPITLIGGLRRAA